MELSGMWSKPLPLAASHEASTVVLLDLIPQGMSADMLIPAYSMLYSLDLRIWCCALKMKLINHRLDNDPLLSWN